jgi:uncharacterized protein YcfJ
MKYSAIFLTLLLTSCSTNTGTGVLAGGIIGASIGGIVGGGNGSLIGSAAGILTGGLIGTALDVQDRKVMEKNSPRTVDRMDRGEPLTINDVIKLSQSGVNDETIIRYITNSPTVYNLSQAQIRRLKDAGVSQRVINEMLQSR